MTVKMLKINDRGGVTIPVEIRKELNITEQDILVVSVSEHPEKKNKRIIIEKWEHVK